MARILIVEDEAVLRLTFEEFLRDEGYDVATAADYGEAVAHLAQGVFDVIVTDIILPGKTGVDLLRFIKEQGRSEPVAMITGQPDVTSAAEAVRLGAFDYLMKPVTQEALLRVARLASSHCQLARERDEYAACMDMYRRDLEAIFNSVKEGIITVGADMLIRQANSAASTMLRLDAAKASGTPIRDVLAGPLAPALLSVERTVRTERPQPETRIEVGTGRDTKVLVITTMPLISEGRRFDGAVLVARDVTRLTRLEQQLEDSQQYRDIIGKSPHMRDIFRLLKDLAETDSTALICGESGTGKELVASALHYASPRAEGPFVRVNCAALSENILESELFGHVKGAFTGAVKDRIGRFEAAHGGTILLDEIGDVSPRLQLRLLRVLQDHEFERVGDSTPIRSDVRVVACTNQDLERKIREGEFRQDLYYRLNVVRIEIPPLRERRQDVPLLIDHFCRRFNRQFKKEITGLAPETMELFMQYPWPGNVRELENCIERAFIVCHDDVILPKHLPPEFRGGSRTVTPFGGGSGFSAASGHELGRDRIIAVLQQTDWNVAKSARLLGVARNTLYQKMKALHIQRPRSLY